MRSVAANRNSNKKKRRRVQEGSTQEKRRQLSKSKDPLYGGNQQQIEEGNDGDDGDNNNNSGNNETKIFTSNENPGYSTSGRQKWKQSHKKGKFNTKAKKNSPLVVGSFTRTKRYK